MSYIYKIDEPCYVIEDDRHFDPECGHFFSAMRAYRELARTLIRTDHHKLPERYKLPDAKDPEFGFAWNRLMKIELRLARWLAWRDSKDGVDTTKAITDINAELWARV